MAAAAAVTLSRLKQRLSCMKETALKKIETNIDQASLHIQTGDINNPLVYSRTCMQLGSCIDYAIAMNASPSSLHLPQLLLVVKEVYKRKTELLQPSLMLLMLPIKAACQIGWFPDGDKDDLLMIAKEVSYGFCSTDKMNIEPTNAHSRVSNIVSRFYPTMKVEHILTTFDVKSGYGAFVADFHISLGATPRHCRNLWLLVAQLDNMETADCITNPLNVDFLINGCAVPNRTKNDMEKGPQLPSNITKMVKHGVNLLQVFGEFDVTFSKPQGRKRRLTLLKLIRVSISSESNSGPYIIALAFLNSISPDHSQLQDYLRPMSDCAIVELSSRISLYCPISRHRIKTPVKGHLCKHPQCFDYNHYIEVNFTKPTWKCPLCNNPVCNQDLRIDQDFLKILNEVAEDVSDVIISEDGSWMVAETDDTTVTTPAVSLGQTQVNAFTTNQAHSTTMFTPPAAVIKHEVSPSQTQVNDCTTPQAKSTTMLTPPAVFPGQIQVNACTTNQGHSTTMFTPPAAVIKHEVSPGQTQVNNCTTMQAKCTTTLKPTAVSPGQTQVNVCTSNQGQSTTFTPLATVKEPPVFPGQTQVNVCTTTEAKSTTMLTPPEGSPSQTQVNVCTSNQGQRSTFTPPATVKEPPVSPGKTQVNVCTTTKPLSTPMFTSPTFGESQTGPNISQVSPAQHPEASGDGVPCGRMRGSLTGEKLEAARLQYLAPPQQPARANEPWSRPPVPSLPLPFIMRKNPSGSDHV